MKSSFMKHSYVWGINQGLKTEGLTSAASDQVLFIYQALRIVSTLSPAMTDERLVNQLVAVPPAENQLKLNSEQRE